MNNFKKCKEECPTKEKFYSYLTSRKINGEEYEQALNV